MLSIDSIYNIFNDLFNYDIFILGLQEKYKFKSITKIKDIIYNYNFTQNLLLYLNKDNLIAKEICNIVFLENNNNFNYIPNQFKTKNMYIKYFYTNPRIYNDIPKEYLTNKIIELYEDIITFGENDIRGDELCILALKYDINNIIYINKNIITQKIVDVFFRFFDINKPISRYKIYNLRTFYWFIDKGKTYNEIIKCNLHFIGNNIQLKFLNDKIFK